MTEIGVAHHQGDGACSAFGPDESDPAEKSEINLPIHELVHQRIVVPGYDEFSGDSQATIEIIEQWLMGCGYEIRGRVGEHSDAQPFNVR